jgi:hypothetical protein
VAVDHQAIDTGERDIRVDDYLNDKLQTDADFANLDSLIASIETQRVQLEDQVGNNLILSHTLVKSVDEALYLIQPDHSAG